MYFASLQCVHPAPLVVVQKSCHALHSGMGSCDDVAGEPNPDRALFVVPAHLPYVMVAAPAPAMLHAIDTAVTTSTASTTRIVSARDAVDVRCFECHCVCESQSPSENEPCTGPTRSPG